MAGQKGLMMTRFRRNRAAAGVGLAAACLTLVVAGSTPASAAAGVNCQYRFTAWNGGFSADVYIVNNGPTINGWTVHWTFEHPTTVQSTWLATIAQRDPLDVTARNLTWNAVIPTGATTFFGWTAKAAGHTVPTDLTINGTPC
jgi:hypothetical protein